MKKPSKAPLIISYVLVIAMMLAAVGLLIGQAAFSGWVFESENVIKFGVIIMGLMITLVRLISKTLLSGHTGWLPYLLPAAQ